MSDDRTSVWVGGGQNIQPETDASTGVDEIIQLVPALLLADQPGMPSACLVEAIYLHFSVRRILTTTFDALAFLVWVGQVQEAGNNPVQALDALSLQPRLYSNKVIMM